MWAVRRFQRHFLKPLPLLNERGYKVLPVQLKANKEVVASQANPFLIFPMSWVSGIRSMSTIRGRTMRSKVEKRMQRETGKTLLEMRRAKKIRKKLMTEEERLIFNLRSAKKKVALLLQKLKKYELPELPAPVHDPELITPEQLQAYKKIGYKNKNYAVVGVRGVFGGVVQNMHLHWKFHETVQVCCDNFPKEKIKEMATMIARLSGGIVINIHDTKTLIMFRGRNYRQPKQLIPLNTLTKRKALFKARFEQALESQKLNIKKIEQQLRRKGVNPEDPIAMASIKRVASTFFRAIDEKQGTPYVFHGDRGPTVDDGSLEAATGDKLPADLSAEDSDQEELDRFIAEIETAADQEWEAEELREQEQAADIRYRSKEEVRMMMGGDPEEDSEEDSEEHHLRHRDDRQRTMGVRKWDNGDDNSKASEGGEWDENSGDEDGRKWDESSGDEDEEDARVNARTRPRRDEAAEMRNGGRFSEESERTRPRRDEAAEMRNRGRFSEDSERTRPRRDEAAEMRNGGRFSEENERTRFSEESERTRFSEESERTRPRRDETAEMRNGGRFSEESGGSESDVFGDSYGDGLWESEDEKDHHGKADAHDFHSGSNFSDGEFGGDGRSRGRTEEKSKSKKNIDENWDSD